jgi:hypothetical protein
MFNFHDAVKRKKQKANRADYPQRVWDDLKPRLLKSVDSVELVYHFSEFIKPRARVRFAFRLLSHPN